MLLIQLMLINISAALYAYRLSHFYPSGTEREPMEKQNVFVKTWRIFTGPRFTKSVVNRNLVIPYDTLTLTTKKGIRINAWYAATDTAAKGTVVLFHGITASKAVLITEANEFYYQGYNVMLVDFRGHGDSDGNTTTAGVREAEEVKLAFDYLQAKGEKNIILYGISMGAVSVARAIDKYGLKPSGIIMEMPFASLQTYLQARARLLGFSSFTEKPFGFLVAGWMGIERGFNGYKHQTARYAKNIHCPVLMQWGKQDPLVLQHETGKIYEAIASADKKLVIYPDAGHESLLENDPVQWRVETERFLSSLMQPTLD